MGTGLIILLVLGLVVLGGLGWYLAMGQRQRNRQWEAHWRQVLTVVADSRQVAAVHRARVQKLREEAKRRRLEPGADAQTVVEALQALGTRVKSVVLVLVVAATAWGCGPAITAGMPVPPRPELVMQVNPPTLDGLEADPQDPERICMSRQTAIALHNYAVDLEEALAIQGEQCSEHFEILELHLKACNEAVEGVR